jgi:lipoate---protein ligase
VARGNRRREDPDEHRIIGDYGPAPWPAYPCWSYDRMMRLLDLSLSTPEDNLALDEALLQQLQAVEASGERPVETLRFWESATPFVVLGRSLRLHEEVDVEAAALAGVPVLRRVSGGGTVVIGPGSLNFTLVLSLTHHAEHRDIRRSMHAIVTAIAEALPVEGLHLAGTSDLCWHDWKVSGHAQRRSRDGLLHHGTLLYGLDLPLMASILREPPRQPDHRAKRTHLDFARNLPLDAATMKTALARAWGATPPAAEEDLNLPPLDHLVKQKYGNARWNEEGALD